MELCMITGNGVCLTCKQKPQKGAYCRKNVVEIIENQKEVIEDLASFIINNCNKNTMTKEELYDFYEYYTIKYIL